MNRNRNENALLDDVLAEGDLSGLREVFLADTLRRVRTRKRVRHVQIIAAVCGLLAILAALVMRTPVSKPNSPEAPRFQCRTIFTSPLSANHLIATRSLNNNQFITTTPMAQIVSTTRNPEIRELGDNELLALSPHPAVLVRLGPQDAALVFVNPDTQEAAPVN